MNQRLAAAALCVVVCSFVRPAFLLAQNTDKPAPATRPTTGEAEVPVKEVVLFSSGVGYFEHFGKVKGDGSTELRFKTEQINDILKSLALQDMDGGKVGTVSYPSQAPIARTLKSFQVDITANPPLAVLLNQLRGAKLNVTGSGDARASGTILGVEKKQRAVGDKEVIDFYVLNLKSGRSIRALPLDELRDIQMEDPRLDQELDAALAALSQSRDQEKKPVTIQFRGNGERRVRVGYVVETPIWKTSYRLVLDGDGAANGDAPKEAPAKQGGQAAGHGGKLQGWAIVENQTDNDWDNVQLSLVSGRPISFIQDLYHSLYVPRPVVQAELYASLRPQTYEGALTREEADKLQEVMNQQQQEGATERETTAFANSNHAPGRMGGGQVTNSLFGNSNTNAKGQNQMDPTASVASIASATKLGELFQYTVGSVSLRRQQSAMIPIVTDDVEVEKLSIFNQEVLASHPLNGARVKNTTKKHLLQGPLTVLEAGSYAGDAQIDDVPPGQERLISYGIDLQMLVEAGEPAAKNFAQTGSIVKGTLHLKWKDVSEQTYVASNKGDVEKTLVIEHPRQPNSKLVAPAAADEMTDTLYRVRQKIGAHKATKLLMREETIRAELLELLTVDVSQIVTYAGLGEIPQKVKQALEEIIRQKAAAAATTRQIKEGEKQIATVTAEQNRIRENMKTVSQTTDYYTRLVKKLDEQETDIESRQKEIAELQQQLETQSKSLSEYITGLTVE